MALGIDTSSGRQIRSQINVTPLVDVVLVLLIIFMVVTPMLERGKRVDLPASRATDRDNPDHAPLVISITADGRIFLGDSQVEDAALGDALTRELGVHPGRPLLLKADRALSVGAVRKVIDIARAAGAPGVALGVREIETRRP